MAIRKAKYGDIRAMAEVAAAAWIDEELYGHLMHPYRDTYPEDFVKYFERKISKDWYMPNRHFLVGLDPDSGKVAAIASWDRQVDLAENSSSWTQHLDVGKGYMKEAPQSTPKRRGAKPLYSLNAKLTSTNRQRAACRKLAPGPSVKLPLAQPSGRPDKAADSTRHIPARRALLERAAETKLVVGDARHAP